MKNREYQKMGDSELLIFLNKGDKMAFDEIYRRYIDKLYTLAYRYVKSRDDSADIIQQVFLKIWVIHNELDISINIKNYLFAMTRNALLNYIRDNTTKLRHNYIIAQQKGEEDDIYELAARKNAVRELLGAIDGLPLQQRKVALYRCEGLSNVEISKKMNLSLNTINTHYKQSLINLKKVLVNVLKILVLLLVK